MNCESWLAGPHAEKCMHCDDTLPIQFVSMLCGLSEHARYQVCEMAAGPLADIACVTLTFLLTESASTLCGLSGHTGRVNCVRWLPDPHPGGQSLMELVSASSDGTVAVWGRKVRDSLLNACKNSSVGYRSRRSRHGGK